MPTVAKRPRTGSDTRRAGRDTVPVRQKATPIRSGLLVVVSSLTSVASVIVATLVASRVLSRTGAPLLTQEIVGVLLGLAVATAVAGIYLRLRVERRKRREALLASQMPLSFDHLSSLVSQLGRAVKP